MAKRLIPQGHRYGRLIVIKEIRQAGKYRRLACVCDCGRRVRVELSNLISGRTKSCGCFRREATSKARSIHGKSHKIPEYGIWQGMRSRCNNNCVRKYKDYGGRGIRVCARWENFGHFYTDMGVRPSPLHSLDRINVNGDYKPSNCRWATAVEQANNKRRHTEPAAIGLGVLAREFGIKPTMLYRRLNRGFSLFDALTQPAGHKYNNKIILHNGEAHSISDWAKIARIPNNTLHWRLSRGWSIDKALTMPLRPYP